MVDYAAFYDDTRSDWNARPPTRARTSVDISRRTEFFNHYIGPGSPNFMARPHSECLAKVNDWQLQHQTRPNDPWKDIGYKALICGHGRCIEGRGLGYAGSHCPNHNTTGFGVQFMVAGTERPTDAMYARMRRLYDDLVKAKGGALAKRGHRDGVATTCPGDIVYAWVKAGMPAPTPPPPPPPPPMDWSDMADLKVQNPSTGVLWPADRALWSIWHYSIAAARDAAIARALGEAAAKTDGTLTDAQVEEIAERVGVEFDERQPNTPEVPQ